MSDGTCPDCGKPRASAKHITELPGYELPAGTCGALLHPCWADDCEALAFPRLKAQLAESERKLADMTTARDMLFAEHRKLMDDYARRFDELEESERKVARLEAELEQLHAA